MKIMRPFWPCLKIVMYTLHRMYQRLLHPTKLYQAAHTVPLVYLYIQVHFLPVIYIPSTSRLSTEWTLKAPCTFPTRAVHAHSSTKLLCMIATTYVLTIFSTNSFRRNLISVQELVRAFMHELFATAWAHFKLFSYDIN